ncbi:MAG: prephenate dehydrogenase/arogenate dehydrogenase family protein [Chitinispirillaceae bacterium]
MNYSPKTITIYSVGLLGGSIGAALKKTGFKGKIIGLSSEANLNTARELNLIDEGYPYQSLAEVIKETDLLILCSPILTILRTIENLGKMDLPEHLIISDVGSTKKEIMQAARKHLPSSVHFIGGHPMAGSEKSGPSASDPYLFENAIYVLTPPEGKPDSRDEGLSEFLKHHLGCRHFFLDPELHDRIAAAVSHVPHILASALVLAAGKQENEIEGTLSLAAGGFRDMTRIASAPYSMWHDILVTNKTAITPLLESFIDTLSEIKRDLLEDSLQEAFEKAREIRKTIPLSSKGFIGRLSEILIMAEDQPGFISSVSSLLARKNINIKDIEVLKVREGEGGTIRMAFDSPEIAQEAIETLNSNGYSARERS